jgi:hypothetical protein
MKNPGQEGFQIWEPCLTGRPFVISKTLYPSDSGKIQSFDIESKEVIKTITDLELEHGFCG